MVEESNQPHPTLALSTKLEEDFVSPLTAIRGALEILRDFPELTADERRRFVETSLRECARLENGVAQLGTTVYAAGQQESLREPGHDRTGPHTSRIHLHEELEVIEIDLSDLEFRSSTMVNDFYDVLDRLIEGTGRSWYFVVNYRDCSIWPEAWVAFAHRGKKVNVSYALGSVRYVERTAEGEDAVNGAGASADDTDILPSRELAFARIAEMRRSAPRRNTGVRRAR